MSQHLREGWAALHEAMPSWRPLHEPSLGNFWQDHDAVIMTIIIGRARTYEVYTFGEIIAHTKNLDGAKRAVEEVYGPLDWKRILMPKEWAEHYYFGWTPEFTEPLVVYVVDHLPKLGVS